MKRFLAFALVLALAAPAFAEQDEKTVAAVKAALEKSKDIKSFTADYKIVAGEDGDMGSGNIKYLRESMIRLTAPTEFGGESISLYDGKILFVLVPDMGITAKVDMVKVKAALKDLGVPDMADQHDITRPFAIFDGEHFKLEQEVEEDGIAYWVFSGRQRAMPTSFGNGRGKIMAYVSKLDGTRRKLITGIMSKPQMSVVYQNVKINADLKPADFTYTPKENEKIMDNTDSTIALMKQLLAPRVRQQPQPAQQIEDEE